jgi:hypothetical protein
MSSMVAFAPSTRTFFPLSKAAFVNSIVSRMSGSRIGRIWGGRKGKRGAGGGVGEGKEEEEESGNDHGWERHTKKGSVAGRTRSQKGCNEDKKALKGRTEALRHDSRQAVPPRRS